MKTIPFALGATLGATATARAATSAQLCQGHSVESGGNWYCQAVQQIVYQGVGASGQYQDVVGMNQATGACSQQARAFSGPLAPFNEPMSLHFRGPLYLKQLAVYMPTGNAKREEEEAEDEDHERMAGGLVEPDHRVHTRQLKQDGTLGEENIGTEEEENGEENKEENKENKEEIPGEGGLEKEAKDPHHHSHNHNHSHNKRHHANGVAHVSKRAGDGDDDAHPGEEDNSSLEKRAEWVTATIDGKVVSWVNNYFGPGGQQQQAAPPATAVPLQAAPPKASSPGGAASAPPPPSPAASPGRKGYSRVAYFNAPEQKASGLTFLGNYGGQGSGKWTTTFGNTISYVNALGTGGASKATVLSNTTIPSGVEFAVMTDQACDSSCGYVQPGAVAYKGFGGADKVILLDFSMPYQRGATGLNADMPAVWMLNARIPRTAQYAACSCWGSGCGELDVFEVLSTGEARCKSTVHSSRPGGDSNYFARPAAALMRAAIVFDSAGGVVAIKALSADAGGMADLPAALAAGDVRGYLADSGGGGSSGLSSVFAIA